MHAASPVTVVARWQALPGRVDTILALVAALREQSLAEARCLGYEVFRGADDLPPSCCWSAVATTRRSRRIGRRATTASCAVERILPLLASRQVELLRA